MRAWQKVDVRPVDATRAPRGSLYKFIQGMALGALGLSVSTFIQGTSSGPLVSVSTFIQGMFSGPWVSLFRGG